ncbi:hypothetical protein AYL99_10312 [Fonsecaea erecta]|uniref:Jacalin-type lectin domain-containing protein n=1 Tax=Fonsecaea erecta TaxID=1367422 RepID=A0A178Z6E6_9EURO|nr:hypothetical protein AYL99_10312 [Fonsecaea erecta]OAP55339.1 hypothetical protein AYL99_10312 [Fonsecaea erecta]
MTPLKTGTKAIVTNSDKGGSSGTAFTLTDNKIAVKKITVWVDNGSGGYSDRKLVKAIKLDWTDGKERERGNKTGTSYSFEFDDNEKVDSLDLWTGDRVDRIKLTTDGGRTFDHGGMDYTGGKGGTKHSEEVGNGILLGFDGRADSNELISLGAVFKEDSD